VKYHRVEGKLPSGVAVKLDERLGVLTADFGKFSDFLVDRVAQYSSNVPITFRLDVPESAAVETARALRAMADELVGEQK
jgi:hypothetical protein